MEDVLEFISKKVGFIPNLLIGKDYGYKFQKKKCIKKNKERLSLIIIKEHMPRRTQK